MLVEDLEKKREKANFEVDRLRTNVKRYKDRRLVQTDHGANFKPKDRKLQPDKVSTATFRELAVRIEVNKRRKDIIDALRSTEDADRQMKAATAVILQILGKFKGWDRKWLGRDSVWLPKTIVIAADRTYEMVLTGASMPSVQTGLLRRPAMGITRIRAGEIFTKITMDRSEEFGALMEHVKENMAGTSNKNIDQLHRQVTQPRELHPNGRYFWSFSGWTFELKPPCMRCQYLYSDCVMWGLPKQPEEKIAALEKALESSCSWWSPSANQPCNLCAETVVAAKLHAADHGVVGFLAM
ncbi:hypothetical protein B0T24DRAFT_590225 [Lasiosphaeria ovina]|uniref:Uncharacterized protein n=1 Tax=Lasiosphaeria ovina TaxID=92902 RepID=A0AAE0TSH7_9PEZI|nr:hypothetical protein B0T24DRAFT_590225 [Lasiosphaeria ovina]